MKMVLGSLIESYGYQIFQHFNMSRLGIDDAYLSIINTRADSIFIYSLNEECIRCPYLDRFAYIKHELTRKVNTAHLIHYKVLTKRWPLLLEGWNESIICDVETVFKEFGVYSLTIGNNNCTLETLKEPVNIYLPILTVLLIYLFVFIAVTVAKLTIRNMGFLKKSSEIINNEQINAGQPSEKKRLRSLDTFRGIIITLMIFVNYGAGGYSCLAHVVWFGIHPADLLYPSFLWIMGLCIPLAIRSRLKRDEPKATILFHIFKRACILVLLGICISSPKDLSILRITSVLSRLGVCYFINSTLCLLTMRRSVYCSKNPLKGGRFTDVVRLRLSWLLMIVIINVHTIVVLLVPFQNCPSGYFGPGGNHEYGKYSGCTGGIAGYIDRTVLGEHIFRHGLARTMYKSDHYDPEGLLGTLPSLVHVCLGVQAGFTLLTFKEHKNRILRWLIWGVVTGLMGGFLCNFSASGGIIPLCKALWTPSFMLVSCSFAFISFAACYMVVDVMKIWSGKPFTYPGMNSIAMYAGHRATRQMLPFTWCIKNHNTHFIKLLSNTTGTFIWIIIAYIMFKNKTFIKI